jgi:acetylornithine deacetylase/succinyl-diaminopimelate desuccinylase-like protein
MIEEKEVIDLVSKLVQIDSVNPWLVKGSVGEAEVVQFIAAWLKPYGVQIHLEEAEKGRFNLVARLPGSGSGKSLCIYAHTDTVGYELWRDRALHPRLENDRLYGLGSADDKGHCAVAMLVLKSIVESKIHLGGDLWLALLVDEEGASSGAFDFVKRHKPDGLVVLEPFGLGSITVTHQGFGWLDIIVKGRAAHGSAPDKGIDAILHMSEVITRLGKLDREKYAASAHPLNGKNVFHTGVISGGTYPSECTLGIEIGTQPGETIQDRMAEIQSIFNDVKELHPNFEGQVHVQLARDPFMAKDHEPLWDILAAQVEKATGKQVKASGENAWGDAAIFQDAGIPTLMLGAKGDNFHAPEEWVSIPELSKLIEIIESTVIQFCT